MTETESGTVQEPRGKEMGVVGPVQYDLDVQCFADSHEESPHLMPTEETSDKNNPILECPECGFRVAVDAHVKMVAGGDGS